MLLRFRAAVAGLAIAIHAPLCLPGADTLPRRAAEGLLLSEVEFPPVASAPIDFAVDSAGAIYVAASITESQRESWEIRAKGQAQLGTGAGPVAVPCGPFPPIKRDIFVAKVSPDGRQLDYLKFVGGAGDDLAAAIAVDGAGRAFVTGYTDSRDFPGVEGGSSAKNLGRDVFVLELSADGSQVVRATLLGGNDRDEAHDIAIDASNAIYIAGETVSPDFPARNSLPRSPAKGGMLRSGNGGVTWLESNGGLVERRIRAIVPDARQEGVVYAVTNAGLFRSVDAGASWQAASQSLGPEVVLTVAVDPQDSSILYTGTENGVFKTVDAGTTWFSLSAGLVGNSLRVTHIAIDPANPSTVYLGTAAGVFKSSDGGRNWVLLPLNQAETRALALDPGNPSTLYVSQFTPGTCGFLAIPARSTLVKSTDGGATFESVLGQIGEGENFFKPVIHGLAVNPVDSMNLYAATSKGVFRSGDGGANWLLRNEGLPGGDGSGQQVPREARAVVIDPSNPSTVYALLSGATQVRGEVFASHDAGATWQRVDFGAGEGITAFAADPKNSARLYAGTAEHPGQDGFVAKLAPGSRSLEFSTILGGSGVDAAWFVAADASGYAYVGGQTQSDDFPVAGAFQSRRAGEDEIFLAKVAVDGASLAYSTFLGGGKPDYLKGLTVEWDGSVVVAGQTFSPDFPAAAGVRSTLSGSSDAFVTKLPADGSSIVYSGFLGGAGDDLASGVAVASNGQVYVTGRTASPNFPVTEFGAGCGRFGFDAVPFLTKLDRMGARIEHSLRLGDPFLDYAVPQGIVAGAGDEAFLLIDGQTVFTREKTGSESRFGPLHAAKFDLSATAPRLSAPCVVNAASLISGPVAPGEIVTIYGNGMGPEEFVVGQPGSRLPLELAGTRVLFDGEPGAVVHVQSNQVSVVAPLSAAGKSSLLVEVERDGQRSAAAGWLASAAHPGIFTQGFSGHGPAVYNDDWTLNSFENPARSGSAVAVFLNGGGLTDPPVDPAGFAGIDAPLARLKLPVTAAFNEFPAAVEYAGTAAGMQHGVTQVNVRIPLEIRQKTSARDFRLVVAVDGLLSQAVFVAID